MAVIDLCLYVHIAYVYVYLYLCRFMCMNVCIHIYIYICMFVFLDVHICLMYVCICDICMSRLTIVCHVRLDDFMFVCTYDICIYIWLYVCMFMCWYDVVIYICMYVEMTNFFFIFIKDDLIIDSHLRQNRHKFRSIWLFFIIFFIKSEMTEILFCCEVVSPWKGEF